MILTNPGQHRLRPTRLPGAPGETRAPGAPGRQRWPLAGRCPAA
jgi:hypothetical protein